MPWPSASTPGRKPTNLLDLPDALLVRIFEHLVIDEGRPCSTTSLLTDSATCRRLKRYRAISWRLHYRVVAPIANRTLFISDNGWTSSETGSSPYAQCHAPGALPGTEHLVERLHVAFGPRHNSMHFEALCKSLVNVTSLHLAAGHVTLSPALMPALRSLRSLRMLVLRLDQGDLSAANDAGYTIALRRDLPSVAHLAVLLPEIPRSSHDRSRWPCADLGNLRILEMTATSDAPVDWTQLKALILHAESTTDPKVGKQLATHLEWASSHPGHETETGLQRLVISVAHAHFFLFAGWHHLDRVLASLSSATRLEELEVCFDRSFRCDGETEDLEVSSIRRLSFRETSAPTDGRQSANLNGLEEFLDIFASLEYLSLTSHWLLPIDDANDLRNDPDPPTHLSLAYDAPQLAQQAIWLRDETDVREFRYRRSSTEDWELRWTRAGGRGTQFKLSRWWL